MTGPLQRVRAFDRRHPLPWDLTVAVLVALVSINATPELHPVGIGCLLIMAAALTARRRMPVVSLTVTLAVVAVVATASSLGLIGLPWTYAAAWVALFNLGWRRGDRQLLMIVGAVALTACAAFLAPLTTPIPDLSERLHSAFAVTAMCAASFLAGAQFNIHRQAVAARQREATHQAVLAERSRVAHEMHDIIGHNLSVMTSLANGGVVAVRNSPEDAERAFEAIGDVSRSSMRKVRHVLSILRYDSTPEGAPLTPQPALHDIDALIDSVRAAGLQVSLQQSGTLQNISAGLQLAVYRTIQEALTNVLRHADTHARVSVTLAARDTELFVQIDNTTGARPEDQSHETATGLGILGMRERAGVYGGTLDARPTPTGWRVRARFPNGEYDSGRQPNP